MSFKIFNDVIVWYIFRFLSLNLNHEMNTENLWWQGNWGYGNFCAKHKHANVDGPEWSQYSILVDMREWVKFVFILASIEYLPCTVWKHGFLQSNKEGTLQRQDWTRIWPIRYYFIEDLINVCMINVCISQLSINMTTILCQVIVYIKFLSHDKMVPR